MRMVRKNWNALKIPIYFYSKLCSLSISPCPLCLFSLSIRLSVCLSVFLVCLSVCLSFCLIISILYIGDPKKPIPLPLDKPFYLYAYDNNNLIISILYIGDPKKPIPLPLDKPFYLYAYDNNNLIISILYIGDPKKPIPLPLDKPFYLYAYGSSDCQVVIGAQVKKELVHFEMNTKTFHEGEGGAHPFQGGLGNSNHRLTYCYYKPGKIYIFIAWSRDVRQYNWISLPCGMEFLFFNTVAFTWSRKTFL
jgi:hypothetical protein